MSLRGAAFFFSPTPDFEGFGGPQTSFNNPCTVGGVASKTRVNFIVVLAWGPGGAPWRNGGPMMHRRRGFAAVLPPPVEAIEVTAARPDLRGKTQRRATQAVCRASLDFYRPGALN